MWWCNIHWKLVYSQLVTDSTFLLPAATVEPLLPPPLPLWWGLWRRRLTGATATMPPPPSERMGRREKGLNCCRGEQNRGISYQGYQFTVYKFSMYFARTVVSIVSVVWAEQYTLCLDPHNSLVFFHVSYYAPRPTDTRLRVPALTSLPWT